MKKILPVVFLLMGFVNLYAQLPGNWNPFSIDILDVPPLYDDGSGQLKSALAYYISSDTSATGERNPNRIYRLQRYKSEYEPGIYVLDFSMNIDFPLKIVAEDGSARPPMIAPGYATEGGVIDYYFRLLSDNQHHVFKNIFFQRINLERTFIDDWERGLVFDGNNLSVKIEGCIFNAFTGNSLTFNGNDNSVYMRDNVWRNGQWHSHPWVGQQISMGNANHIDTLIFTNNTYFNNNSYWLFHKGHVIDHFVFEHNTIMTSTVDALVMKLLVNANIRSNLFYGYAAFGDTEFARSSGSWYEADGDSLAHISLDPLGRITSAWGKTEADRQINLTHNAYYTPQGLKNYYTAHANYNSPKDGSTDPVTAPLWMNEKTKSMFNDDDAYPCLNANDNIGGIDPQFTDTEVDNWVVETVAQWCTDMRATATEQGWGSASNRNYDLFLEDDILSGIQWPLPEGEMEITNPQLLTAGHDGLPIGNLNWNPALRAQYTEPEAISCNTTNIDLYKNQDFYVYPNSSGEILNIANTSQIQMIEVFNIVGKKFISKACNKTNSSQIDISLLKSGVYIVRITSDNYTGSKKFIKQ